MPLYDIGLIWDAIPVSGVLVQHIIENGDLPFHIVLCDDPVLTHIDLNDGAVRCTRQHGTRFAGHVGTNSRNTISGIDLFLSSRPNVRVDCRVKFSTFSISYASSIICKDVHWPDAGIFICLAPSACLGMAVWARSGCCR